MRESNGQAPGAPPFILFFVDEPIEWVNLHPVLTFELLPADCRFLTGRLPFQGHLASVCKLCVSERSIPAANKATR